MDKASDAVRRQLDSDPDSKASAEPAAPDWGRPSKKLVEAIEKRNAGQWLTRKQFWLLKSRGIDPLGPSDEEHRTKEGWDRWRERIKGLNSRNYPFATEPGKAANVTDNQDESRPPGRRKSQRDLMPAEKERALDAREFVDAIKVYPPGCQFTLWNLQGVLRFSCDRRGKAPAEVDFAREIELAKRLGWLRELPEDVDETAGYQGLYKCGPIRYGQTFVCLAKRATINAEWERFVSEFVDSTSSTRASSCKPN